MSQIKLTNVCKYFGDKKLFDNLNLEIEKGEFLGIMGESGSGKTTLLNIIGLITGVDNGCIEINGVSKLSTKGKKAMMLRRHTLGYLFQNYGLIDDATVFWNLKLALEYKHLNKKEKEQKITDLLQKFGLLHLLNNYIYQLSGGEQQRIAIIKLILQDSTIILADEPTSGLDEKNEMIVMEELKKLNKSGVTVILVTHNTNLKNNFSKIIMLDNLKNEAVI